MNSTFNQSLVDGMWMGRPDKGEEAASGSSEDNSDDDGYLHPCLLCQAHDAATPLVRPTGHDRSCDRSRPFFISTRNAGARKLERESNGLGLQLSTLADVILSNVTQSFHGILLSAIEC